MSNADISSKPVHRSDGTVVELHARVGEGGEGVVFHVGGDASLVAKIYKPFHSEDERKERERKLAAIVDHDNEKLRLAGAWPQEILRDEEGNFAGFVMEFLGGYMPLHMAYQIKSRAKRLPGRTFAFLVRVARNLAACVHFVHEAGLVIGDMNESNVHVTAGAMVRLIDCDSFQVEVNGEVLTPKVGKTELMPPELQGVELAGRRRRPEEDQFTLAVLIFQILAFGRHPFAGRPKDDRLEITPEMAIEEGYYVYTQRRDIPIDPPPFLDVSWAPPNIQEMFEDAFEAGKRRPTAEEWYKALSELENELVSCSDNEHHVHWTGIKSCPWCELEKRWGIGLFSGQRKLTAEEEAFDLDKLWDRLKDYEHDGLLEGLPEPTRYLEDAPSLAGADKVLSRFKHVSIVGLFLAFHLGQQQLEGRYPPAVWAAVAGLGVLFGLVPMRNWLVASMRESKMGPLKERYQAVVDQWASSADSALIETKIEDYRKAIDAYRALPERQEELRTAALRVAYGAHLERYLKNYSLAIADVRLGDRAMIDQLMNRGMKTAADIDAANLKKFVDPKDPISKELLEWVERLEAHYWQSTNYGLDAAKEREIFEKVERERRKLRKELESAIEEMKKYGDQLKRNQETILREYQKIAPEYARRQVAIDAYREAPESETKQTLNA